MELKLELLDILNEYHEECITPPDWNILGCYYSKAIPMIEKNSNIIEGYPWAATLENYMKGSSVAG